MTDQPKTNTIQSVERTFEMLETMRDRGAVGITELAEQLDVSKSTVHNHLNTMEGRGYVVNDGGTYRLGLRLLSFPNTLQKSHWLYQAAKDEVDELVERTGERSQVLVEEDGYGVYIYQQTDDRAITTNSKVGTRVTLHSSAIGKAMLAFQPEERVERILHRDGLAARTENTITSREAFEAELAEIRDEGVAFDDEEGIEGMRCVAAPIRNEDSVSVGAISVSGPCTRIAGERFESTLPREVERAAQAIEIKYRYS
jgi:DNA-binding IclR family transcriptional regulator